MRRHLGAVAMLLSVTVSGGMSGGCSAQRSDGADTARSRVPPMASDINAQPRERVRTGGTLRWPLPEFPTQWNVHHVNGSKGVVERVLQGLLPYPVRVDGKGVSRIDPDYLLSAKLIRRTPAQVVGYTLNPKARWSDGTPVTYRDFAAQARALSGADGRFKVAVSTGYAQIAKVERGRDDRQAVVTFARPFGDWMGLFRPLYPASTTAHPAEFNRGWIDRVPVTAGPFKIEAIDRTAKTIAMVRDPRWWGRPAKLDRIVFRVMDPAAACGAFVNGEIDVLDIGNDADAYERVSKVRGVQLRRAAGPDWRQLTFNAARPPLSDPQVRRAIAAGLDRKAIAASDLAGLHWPARPLGNHFFMNTQEGYQDNSAGTSRYDPALAGRLLDGAGWRSDGHYRRRDGRPLRLQFVVPAGQATGRREGELVQAMLKNVGVRVDIRPVPADDLFDRHVTTGDFDIVPFSWLGTPWPVMSLRSVFARVYGDQVQQNYARTGSEAIDAAMDRAAGELDPARSRRLVNAADRLIWEQVGVLPLYQRPQVVATRGGLANIGARGFADLSYEDIGFSNG